MASAKKWDELAPDYEKAVFNVFNSDINKLLLKTIRKHGSKRKIAGDFGCGVGRAVPMLSNLFKKVYALDFSPVSVELAEKFQLSNVTCKVADLSKPVSGIPKVDFGLCVNVAISEDMKKNYAILNNVCSALKKKGVAVFVLPSWESASMVTWRTMQLYGKEGTKVHEIPDDFLDFYVGKKVNPEKGIFNVDGAATKHWLISEFMTIFEKPSLQIESIEKIEYAWTTELTKPPSWLGYPFPWDWMVVVKKK